MNFRFLLVLAFFLIASCPLFSGQDKVFLLNSGEKIIGSIEKVAKGKYSVKTVHGIITLKDSEIKTIFSQEDLSLGTDTKSLNLTENQSSETLIVSGEGYRNYKIEVFIMTQDPAKLFKEDLFIIGERKEVLQNVCEKMYSNDRDSVRRVILSKAIATGETTTGEITKYSGGNFTSIQSCELKLKPGEYFIFAVSMGASGPFGWAGNLTVPKGGQSPCKFSLPTEFIFSL